MTERQEALEPADYLRNSINRFQNHMNDLLVELQEHVACVPDGEDPASPQFCVDGDLYLEARGHLTTAVLLLRKSLRFSR